MSSVKRMYSQFQPALGGFINIEERRYEEKEEKLRRINSIL